MVLKQCQTCQAFWVVPAQFNFCPLCLNLLQQVFPLFWGPGIPLSTNLSVTPLYVKPSSMNLWKYFPGLSASNVIQSLIFSRIQAMLAIREEYRVELYTGHNRGRRLVMERILPTERLSCDLALQPYEWSFSKTKNYFQGSANLTLNPGKNQSLFKVMMASRLEFEQERLSHSRISGEMNLGIDALLDPTLVKRYPFLTKFAPKLKTFIKVQSLSYVANFDYPWTPTLRRWSPKHPISSIQIKVEPKVDLSMRAKNIQCGPFTLYDPHIESSIKVLAFDTSDTKFSGNVSGIAGHGGLEMALPTPKPRDTRIIRGIKTMLPKKIQVLKANTYNFNFDVFFNKGGKFTFKNLLPSTPRPSLDYFEQTQPGGMFDLSNHS